MSRKNSEEKKVYNRDYFKGYYLENRGKILAKNRQWYLDNKEKATEMKRESRKKQPEKRKEDNQKLKEEVLTHYGGGKLACVKCGFSDVRALSIDHIENNGAEHRKQIGQSVLYSWLKKRNYPRGYQTLCMNCQWIKRLTK